ncbi:MAG: GDSL-type esterase/lipase family protein [Anaerolineae bacterium]
MRIVCFGDSLTEGAYGGSYFKVLRRLRSDLDLVNGGVGGDTVLNLLERLDEDVLALQPDGVFVMIGGNDAVSFSQPKVRSYYKNGKGVPDGVVSPDDFARAYRELLERLHLAHVVSWVGLPPVEANRTLVDTLADFNARARDAARSYGAPVLDLAAEFVPDEIPVRPPLDIGVILTIGQHQKSGWRNYEGAKTAGGYTFTFDGLHLMPDAAERMGAFIAAFLP